MTVTISKLTAAFQLKIILPPSHENLLYHHLLSNLSFLSRVLTFLRLPSQKCPIKLTGCTLAFRGKHLVYFKVIYAEPEFTSQLAARACRLGWWQLPGSPERLFHIQREALDVELSGWEGQCSFILMATLLGFKKSRRPEIELDGPCSHSGSNVRLVQLTHLSPVSVLRS